MRAITFSTYGGPDVLQLSEVPVPEPGPGQVRLAVRAAGINPIDWKIRNGFMQQNFQVPFPAHPRCRSGRCRRRRRRGRGLRRR